MPPVHTTLFCVDKIRMQFVRLVLHCSQGANPVTRETPTRSRDSPRIIVSTNARIPLGTILCQSVSQFAACQWSPSKSYLPRSRVREGRNG